DLNKCVISSFPEGEGAPTLENIQARISSEASREGKDSDIQVVDTEPSPNESPTPAAPSKPQPPEDSGNPPQNRPTNNLLTLTPSTLLPGLRVNTPCVQVTMLLGTCRAF